MSGDYFTHEDQQPVSLTYDKHEKVSTMVELTTCEIRYLLHAMWEVDPVSSIKLAGRAGVDDVKLEQHLTNVYRRSLRE
tara:strand:- start:735 stop:971 length:237 start_codon:yes stop_codon:yes gene_type:complete